LNIRDQFILILLLAFVIHQLTMFLKRKMPTLVAHTKIRFPVRCCMNAITLLNGNEQDRIFFSMAIDTCDFTALCTNWRLA
jgi:hypothetical protein